MARRTFSGGSGTTSDALANLQTSVEGLSSNVVSLQDSLDALQLDHNALEADVGTLESDLDALADLRYVATQMPTGTVASVTFSSIPGTLRTVRLSVTARGDTNQYAGLNIRINGSSGAAYRYSYAYVSNTSNASPAGAGGVTSIPAGFLPGSGSGAGIFSSTEITFHGWNAPQSGHLACSFQGGYMDTTSNTLHVYGVGAFGGGPPYTSITLFPGAGNFIVGSQFDLEGIY